MQEFIQRLRSRQDLSMHAIASAIDAMMQGNAADNEIAEFLLALREKGETVEEIAGAARAMRQNMTPIRSRHAKFIDTCGTGGDGSGTFNISTAAALVTAAAGLPVAKHGNRSVTSRSGSADVLAALGVNIEADVATVERCLEEVGICFCFAPQLHPSMKHVASVRRSLGVPTIFNLLGPLCNPASAPFQLLGVGKPDLRPRLSAALRLLGCRRAAVVCGDDGLDEVTLGDTTRVTEVTSDSLIEHIWTPESFGLVTSEMSVLRVDGPEASAEVIRAVLAGQTGPHRDIVLLNSAASLWVAGQADSPPECRELAAAAIDNGSARRLLADLVEASQGQSGQSTVDGVSLPGR